MEEETIVRYSLPMNAISFSRPRIISRRGHTIRALDDKTSPMKLSLRNSKEKFKFRNWKDQNLRKKAGENNQGPIAERIEDALSDRKERIFEVVLRHGLS